MASASASSSSSSSASSSSASALSAPVSSSDELRSALLALDRATFYARFAALAVRPDGREAAACRATALRTRVLSEACADGSALANSRSARSSSTQRYLEWVHSNVSERD